jgi:filamentous hemagglutinin
MCSKRVPLTARPLSSNASAANSEDLAALYEEQAAAKFKAGDYTLGKADEYVQRINITIDLPGIGDAASEDGQIG